MQTGNLKNKMELIMLENVDIYALMSKIDHLFVDFDAKGYLDKDECAELYDLSVQAFHAVIMRPVNVGTSKELEALHELLKARISTVRDLNTSIQNIERCRDVSFVTKRVEMSIDVLKKSLNKLRLM